MAMVMVWLVFLCFPSPLPCRWCVPPPCGWWVRWRCSGAAARASTVAGAGSAAAAAAAGAAAAAVAVCFSLLNMGVLDRVNGTARKTALEQCQKCLLALRSHVINSLRAEAKTRICIRTHDRSLCNTQTYSWLLPRWNSCWRHDCVPSYARTVAWLQCLNMSRATSYGASYFWCHKFGGEISMAPECVLDAPMYSMEWTPPKMDGQA